MPADSGDRALSADEACELARQVAGRLHNEQCAGRTNGAQGAEVPRRALCGKGAATICDFWSDVSALGPRQELWRNRSHFDAKAALSMSQSWTTGRPSSRRMR